MDGGGGGGGGGGRRSRWGFLLLTLEDQAAEHQGGCQESLRPRPRPMVDGEERESAWTPGHSGRFPGQSGSISLYVWRCGGLWPPWRAKRVGETRTSFILGSQDLCHCSPWGLGWLPHWDRQAHGHRARHDGSSVHFLWTWTLAYSEWDGSGLGADCLGTRLRWTMSRSA